MERTEEFASYCKFQGPQEIRTPNEEHHSPANGILVSDREPLFVKPHKMQVSVGMSDSEPVGALIIIVTRLGAGVYLL